MILTEKESKKKKDIYKEYEKKLEEHYIKIRRLADLFKMIEMYRKQKSDIEMMIENKFFYLSTDIQAINYRRDKVQTSNHGSLQENAIENFYQRTESELVHINREIVRLEILQRQLDREIKDMDMNLSQLNEKAKAFLSMRYEKRMSLQEIANKTFTTKSSIYRERNKYIFDIMQMENLISIPAL